MGRKVFRKKALTSREGYEKYGHSHSRFFSSNEFQIEFDISLPSSRELTLESELKYLGFQDDDSNLNLIILVRMRSNQPNCLCLSSIKCFRR